MAVRKSYQYTKIAKTKEIKMTKELYFKRQIELWGLEKQELLSEKKIAIIGSGGLGSSLALALGTSGIGELDIVDFDKVSIHNIHRQIAFTLKDEHKYKAKVVSDLILSKNPFLTSKSFICDFEEFSSLAKRYDLILDATDNFATRIQIDKYSLASHIPWIYGSVEEFGGQVCFFKNGSFDAFNKDLNHKPAGIAAPMVMHIASLQANIAIRYLVGLPVNRDKLYSIYFDSDGDIVTRKFNI